MIKKFRLQTVDTSLTIHHLKGHIYFRFCLRSEVIEAGIWIQVGTHSHKCMSLVGAAFCTTSSPILGGRSPEVSGSLSRKQSAGTRGIRTPWHTVQSVNLNCESVDWINLWAQTCSNTVISPAPGTEPGSEHWGPFPMQHTNVVRYNHISTWRKLSRDLSAVCSYLLGRQRGTDSFEKCTVIKTKENKSVVFFPPLYYMKLGGF